MIDNDDIHPKHDQRPAAEASYERPVPATLVVELGDGHRFPAKACDLHRFGYLRRDDALAAVSEAFELAGLALDGDLSPLRYAIERAVAGNPLGTWEGQPMDDTTELDRLGLLAARLHATGIDRPEAAE